MLFLYAQLPPRFFSMFYVLHGSLRDYLFLGIKKKTYFHSPVYLITSASPRQVIFYLLYESFLFSFFKTAFAPKSKNPRALNSRVKHCTYPIKRKKYTMELTVRTTTAHKSIHFFIFTLFTCSLCKYRNTVKNIKNAIGLYSM